MFVFLILAIVIAKLTDNRKQVVIDTNYAVNRPPSEMLIARTQIGE